MAAEDVSVTNRMADVQGELTMYAFLAVASAVLVAALHSKAHWQPSLLFAAVAERYPGHFEHARALVFVAWILSTLPMVFLCVGLSVGVTAYTTAQALTVFFMVVAVLLFALLCARVGIRRHAIGPAGRRPDQKV